jgi:hypothetical protein
MDNSVHVAPTLIEKEIIPNLKFKSSVSFKQQDNLMERLEEATKMGNNDHIKIAIIFQDDEGMKRVETTIWATGAKYICLKGGVWLPINRIKEVQFI